MNDTHHLVQEQLVQKEENKDPEYQRLLRAYAEDPLYDIRRIPLEQSEEKRENTL